MKVEGQESGAASLEALEGTAWVLVDMNAGQQPVLPDTEITAVFANGQVSGSAGCNNYNADVSAEGDSAQSLTIGPAISTQKACPDDILNQETEYLAKLQAATQWSYYQNGRLALTYNLDDAWGTMIFEPQQ